MLSAFQKNWGVEQWVAFLRTKELPVMPRSRVHLAAIIEAEGERIAPRNLVSVVYGDPFLAVKLLRRAEGRRSKILGQETTTALASILQAGVSDLKRTVNDGPACDETLPGLLACVERATLGERIARGWACLHADLSPDEVALAALLSEIGELLLWHIAPELPQHALDELHAGRALRSAQAQSQACGFQFKLLSLALVQAWELPPLIGQLIKGSDSLRANLARQALDTARHLITHPENPALPADIVNIRELLPGVGMTKLMAHLPISDEYRQTVLEAIENETFIKELK